MANGHDVANYELWDLVTGNMFYYTTRFEEIIELIMDNPMIAKDWQIVCHDDQHRSCVLIYAP